MKKRAVQLNRPITMCIAQFNLYLVVLVVAILPITRPAIASHNLAQFNPGIKHTQSRNPGIGKTVRDCIPYYRYAIPFLENSYLYFFEKYLGKSQLPISNICNNYH